MPPAGARPRAPPAPPRRTGAGYDYGYADDSVTTGNDYDGRWVGTWYGNDGTTYSGEYEGRYDGTVRSAGTDYDAPAYAGRPHWSQGGQPYPTAPVVTHGGPVSGGYYAGGYYYPAPTVTTIIVQPATTTTTTYVTEEVHYRKVAVRRKPRATCRCK